jgi:hypothetical protein
MTASTSRLRAGMLLLAALVAMRLIPLAGGTFDRWGTHRERLREARERTDALTRAQARIEARLQEANVRLGQHVAETIAVQENRRAEETLALIVAQRADSCGLLLESINPQSDREQDRALASVDGIGTFDAIVWWLASIEAGTPRLFVESVQLTVSQGANREQVRVRATIVGLPSHDATRNGRGPQ